MVRTVLLCVSMIFGLSWGAAVCPFQVDSIDDLCGAMATESCAVWTGDDWNVPSVNPDCEIADQFELSCAVGSPLALSELLRITLSTSGNLTMHFCEVIGFLQIVGDGVLFLEHVTIRGSLDLGALKAARFRHLLVEGSGTAAGPATVYFNATREYSGDGLTVRQTAPSGNLPCLLDSSLFGLPYPIVRGILFENCQSTVSNVISDHTRALWYDVEFRNCTSDSSVWLVINESYTTIFGATFTDCYGKDAISLHNQSIHRLFGETRFMQCSTGDEGSLVKGYVLDWKIEPMILDYVYTLFNNVGSGGVLDFSSGPGGFYTQAWYTACNTVEGGGPEYRTFGTKYAVLPPTQADLPDVGGSNPLFDVVDPNVPYSLEGDIYSSYPITMTIANSAMIRHPSRGTCARNACLYLSPAGHGVRVRGVDVVSKALDGDTEVNDSDFGLSVSGIPVPVSTAATMYQYSSSGIAHGEILELECCGGSYGCDFFVSVYSCAGCEGDVSDGLGVGLKADDRWQARSCSMQVGRAGARATHPTVTFWSRFTPGEVRRMRVEAGGTNAVFIIAKLATDPAPSMSDWCPPNTNVGPNQAPTCSSDCFPFEFCRSTYCTPSNRQYYGSNSGYRVYDQFRTF